MATRTLLDTNVVLRLLSQSDAQHVLALSAVQAELEDQTDLVWHHRSSWNAGLS